MPGPIRSSIRDGLRPGDLNFGQPWFHPDIRADIGIEQPVVWRAWEDASDHLPVRPRPHPPCDARRSVTVDVGKCVPETPEVPEDDVRTDECLLAR